MTRKVYDPPPDRKKLQQDVLQSMRAARRQIDPALLKQAREAILKAAPQGQPADEPLKAKTRDIIMQYLALNGQDKALMQRIAGMIRKTD